MVMSNKRRHETGEPCMSNAASRWARVWLWAMALIPGFAGAAQPVQEWVAVSPGGSGDAPALFGSGIAPQSQRALAVDAAGNSYVTGSRNNGSNFEYLTQKF